MQVDGNCSIVSEDNCSLSGKSKSVLPTVATYNLRSLFPKIKNLSTDILERRIDVAFLSETWENELNSDHKAQTEELLEMEGLQFISTSRKPNVRGTSYGGAAIIVNINKGLDFM